MKVAVDTNVFGYAAGVNDAARRRLSVDLLDALGPDQVILPSQVAGELYNVLIKHNRFSRADAVRIVDGWTKLFRVALPTRLTIDDALALARDHNLQIWDALILATAADADCGLLLSEDMQDGFVYRGTTVADPFRATLHPLLVSLLADAAKVER